MSVSGSCPADRPAGAHWSWPRLPSPDERGFRISGRTTEHGRRIMVGMSDELQAAWDAAVANCLQGHDACTYGGLTPGTGYWLIAEDCERKHGGECTWCGAEAVTGFAGWAPDGMSIYGVPACQPCAGRWVAEHPEWERREPRMGGPSLDTLRAEVEAEREQVLAAMNPVERELWLAAEKATENMMLWGHPDGPTPGEKMTFGGIESVFGDQPVSMIPCYSDRKPLGPARQRYNPATKTWEADRG